MADGWYQHNAMYVPEPVSALSFDPYQDLLQVGSKAGYLRLFNSNDLSLRISVKAHTTAIRRILNIPFGVLSLSKEGVRLHGRGGIPKATFSKFGGREHKEPKGEDQPTDSKTPVHFNDMCLNASENDTSGNASRLIAATNSSELYVYDMNFIGSKSNHARPFIFSLGQDAEDKGITSINFASSKKAVLCGGGDGTLYIVDGRTMRLESNTMSMRKGVVREMKSASITSRFAAFQNEITSITVNREQVILCGKSTRQMKQRHVYGETSPVDYHAEALVKIYDLRMMRAAMPLQFPFSLAPISGSVLSGHGSILCALAKNGSVSMMDTRYDMSMSTVLQTNTNGQYASSFATAVTGKAYVIGDVAGGVHVWTNSLTPGNVNSSYYAQPLESLPTFNVPDPQVQINATHLASNQIKNPALLFRATQDDRSPEDSIQEGLYAYESGRLAVNRPPIEGGMSFSPSCMYSSLPAGFEKAWAGGSATLGFNKNILKEEKKVDKIGYIDATSRLIENDLAMKDVSGTLLYGQNKWKAFKDVDPRRQWNANESEFGNTGIKSFRGDDGSIIYIDENDNEIAVPPEALRKTKVKSNAFFSRSFGRDGSRKKGQYNNTVYAGLENNLANSYINPLVLTLYFLRPVRNAFIGHLSPLDPCLTDELGFVFHMLDQIQVVPDADKSVELLNFQAAFRRIPEASALGLLEPSKLSLQRRIGHLTRFLMNHVLKEMQFTEERAQKAKAKRKSNFLSPCKYGGNTLEKLFGMRFQNTDVSASNFKTERENMSNVIDLIDDSQNSAPTPASVAAGRGTGTSAAAAAVKKAAPASFASRLKKSMTKEIKIARAWCEGSGKYEPLTKYRRLRNLPQLLCVNVTSGDNDNWVENWRETHRPNTPAEGSRWLPEKIRIKIGPENVDGLAIDELRDENVELRDIDNEATHERVYELVSIISHIQDPLQGEGDPGHLIAHIKTPEFDENGRATSKKQWTIFNDMRIVKATDGGNAVTDFRPSWRSPCVLFYQWAGLSKARRYSATPNIRIHPSIFRSQSLSQGNRASTHKRRSFQPLGESENLSKDDMVAIDCEFVSTGAEESEVDSNGRRVVTKASKLSLARVSVTRANGVPFIDDYILKTEAIVDYLTRFSGILPGDLDPTATRHHLVTLKTAYLKLRYLVDQGVKFVGHGLKKDFRMINIHVPSDQIIDTVHIYHLPGQRMIGLAFLVKHLLGAGIQDASKGHDSIEDAHGALLLYRKYLELKQAGKFEETLNELYKRGHACQWR